MRIMIILEKGYTREPQENPTLEFRIVKLLTGPLRERIHGAVVYRSNGEEKDKFVQDGITYYPVNCRMDIGLIPEEWEETRQALARAIDDFLPDVIQCMGSEWPYGLIAESVSVPVVVHMMGFLNVYYTSLDMVLGYSVYASQHRTDEKTLRVLRRRIRQSVRGEPDSEKPQARISDIISRRERRIMAATHYFMGRTEWDRNLVKYYSPGSKYYQVEEPLKPRIYEAAGQWRYSYHAGRALRLVTISSADDRKGNEIILRTALLLKELLGLEFEWRVAGSRDYFERYEQITGIQHEDVNVDLIGYIGVDDVIDELKRADLFIHPSIIDNSSNAVCEAQMIGCPVIASYVGGIIDLVEDKKTGFLYPYNEPHTLAFLIGNLYRDAKMLNEVSARAVKAACKRHDPNRIAETLYQTYEDIIREHESRTPQGTDTQGGFKDTQGAGTR